MSIAHRLLTKMARRFVAGDTADQALDAVEQLNRSRIRATLDILGENVRDQEDAKRCSEAYRALLQRIRERGVDANVSVKLTMLGLDIDTGVCRSNLLRVVEVAEQTDNFVRIDMEGSDYTQRTLDLFYELFEAHRGVGAAIQAYLYRSEKDIEELIRRGARVRLCKGAYKEPPDRAYTKKREVCASFDRLAERLLLGGDYPAIATHDDGRIRHALSFAQRRSIGKERFELQMLYGLRGRTMQKLAAEGYNTRIYVPFGTHWLPYFVRRLRERKENVFFVLQNLLR